MIVTLRFPAGESEHSARNIALVRVSGISGRVSAMRKHGGERTVHKDSELATLDALASRRVHYSATVKVRKARV